ncbi:hypothetical protein [Geomonas anaerohicana]|uniref:Fibronectin type-III domain-containing protein n=1 Tax=Geomonas anaerohicana TaxID=2798583 RepID=A0ABS0YK43_9BACT|nr:hypothetical protein [Geomonas anaerohicana]MBJ6752711.1 hypothetical protein [Geomonas anaerohicana]
MLVPKHDLSSLTKLSDGDLIHEVRTFAGRIRGHAAFQDVGKHVPVAETFDSLADLLGQKSNAAKHGDKLMAEERDNTREEIFMKVTFACQHSVMFATYHKDPSLMDVGYDLSHRVYTTKPATASVPGQPTKVELKPGPKGSGIYYVLVNKVAGMGSLEVQFTETPNDESSWKSAERAYKCKVEMKGDLVKRYYIRARYHNSAGYGPWSSVVDIVLS